ncbi:ABC transporter ATP-binding protein [Hymenobacter sp. BT683]|uniref:ABC transporter ATP-binding protein n=1 Tax=Hymenobacter jeongseonensis TaxID=2791027 RepID=A0ABS0IKN6_9BACT|nr:ABC transporter ATP-binding protein [Hymenobacter jeongseonensis]MBF9238911.1 ABC transporter ATP-binding protein [Hymenobacter jeongseonensis]
MDLLAVHNISLEERGKPILQQISFTQSAHQKLAIAGESGTGKSTLLQVIAGLVQPNSGEVHVAGSRVRGPAETLVPGHPGVAYLTQNSELPHALRVEQVLRYANQRPEAEAQQLYELCRISHLAERRTNQLSGGEQQRVALARLLLGSPQLLLLDEPFSNLDRAHKRAMQGIIEDLGLRLGITCLLVSHDPADTLSWADEILVMHQGRIIQQGPPARIYRNPINEYTAGLLGDYNLVRGADRQALSPVSKRKAAGTALLVRPEDFRLAPPGNGQVPGTVKAIRFFGSHHELEIVLPHNTVRVRSEATSFEPGTTVGVSLAAGTGWNVALPEKAPM